MTDLNTLAKEINDTATKSGFWPTDRADALAALEFIGNELREPGDDDSEEFTKVRRYIEAQEVRNMGEMLMLMTSELAEALEEHRDGHDPVWYKAVIGEEFKGDVSDKGLMSAYRKLRENPEEINKSEHATLVNGGILKPEGLAVELADCIIRCLDTMQSLGVNVEEVVTEKMRFNASRPYKHGKA